LANSPLGDSYDRNARLYPALIAASPVTLLAFILFGAEHWWSGLIGLAVATGVHFLIVQFVGDMGVRLQSNLWNAWGGAPTSQLLRWREHPRRKIENRHSTVSRVTGLRLATSTEEQESGDDADEGYEEAVRVLRELTRDRVTFPRVRADLENYGFRRNLLGLKPIGIAVAATAVLAGAGFAIWHWLQLPTWAGLVVSIFGPIWLLLWILVISPDFVRPAANRYADALLGAAESLPARI
jgi:hypothetical protein